MLLKTLKKMGCQFSAISDNTDKFISLYDYGWESANLDDIDELSLLRKAINEVNWVSD